MTYNEDLIRLLRVENEYLRERNAFLESQDNSNQVNNQKQRNNENR